MVAIFDGSTQERNAFVRYLGILYFGSPGDIPFSRYINRAYRDFSRTLRGFAKLPGHDEVFSQATLKLSDAIKALAKKKSWTQQSFDACHDAICQDLMNIFPNNLLHYGQAQKWLNMTLKYVFTALATGILEEEERRLIEGIESCYQYAHLPIDNIVLEALKKQGGPAIKRRWSKIDVSQYREFQADLRARYVECPLDMDFLLWKGDGAELTRKTKQ